jgi:methionyl-tRNA formyltransferase
MNILLAGQRSFGAAVLDALVAAHHSVVAVACPLPGGRGPDRLHMAAERHRVPALHGLRAASMPAGVDLIVCAHSHDFISDRAVAKARHGAIGYHPSLLPRHRGRDAVEWTIRMGDAVAGGSVYWLTGRVDGGPLAAQRHVMVRPRETSSDLWSRALFPMGVSMLATVCADIAAGRIVRVPQDEACATWEPSIGRAPLHRPDLIMLPSPGAAGQRFEVTTAGLFP